MVEKAVWAPTDSSAAMRHAAEIIIAYVSNHSLAIPDVSALLKSVHSALLDLSDHKSSLLAPNLKPAVSVKKSVTPEYIVCLEDGKKLKMLKRYLRTHHRLSPDEYRAKWGLPANYPMVAPKYAQERSQTAKEHGLGRRSSRAVKRRKRV